MSSAAFISDIHGNLAALQAVLTDIERRGITQIFCLGDVVGYGPDPAACVDLVRSRCRATIVGNHDEALVVGNWLSFNQVARSAMEWTRKQLRPRIYRPGSRARWKFLAGLPRSFEWEGLYLVHGSPRDPVSEYILPRHADFPMPGMFEEIFGGFESVCLVGHTHHAGVFLQTPRFVPPSELAEGFEYEEGRKLLINVGSVGQPRDRDPRACYVSRDQTARFHYHRVEYPIEETQRKIRATRQLDDRLADRLAEGV